MSSGRTSLSSVPAADDRTAAVDRCRRALADEGFRVTPEGASDLRARRGSRTVRAIVFLPEDVDAPGSSDRIRRTYRGETRVFVPWRLKWRMSSNLERWGIRGVAVSEY